MIRVLIAAAALALTACAPGASDKANESTAVSNASVPAPTPSDISVHITAAQAGQTVHVGLNQRFAVELVGVPTAGYVWTPAQMPAFLTRAGDTSGNTTAAQSQPGFVGGNHWEVLMFSATSAGTGELVIEQRRPWASNEGAVDSFHVTIVAE